MHCFKAALQCLKYVNASSDHHGVFGYGHNTALFSSSMFFYEAKCWGFYHPSGSWEKPKATHSFNWTVFINHCLPCCPLQTELLASCASDRSIVLYDTRESAPLRKVCGIFTFHHNFFFLPHGWIVPFMTIMKLYCVSGYHAIEK